MQTLKHVVQEANKKKIAIGHFNVSTLEQLRAVVSAARKLCVPVIVGVSGSEREFIGVKQISALVRSYRNEGIQIYLNADHTRSLEKVEEAARVGFDAIIFDSANLPFEENIKQTKEAVKIVKKCCSWRRRILVEGELGYIGASSEVLDKIPEGAAVTKDLFTTPEQAKEFVSKTGVDMIAPAVGNIHGMFKNASNPHLDISRIAEIRKILRQVRGKPTSLVLHGGSGISDEDFRAAIDAGISIVHISTELRVAWKKGIEESFREKPDEVAPYKILKRSVVNLEKIIEERLRLFSKLS